MMLFRYSVELAEQYLPDSFLKVVISRYHYPSLPNGTELNFLYPPEQCWDNEFGVADKEKYFSYLFNTTPCMDVIITLSNALQSGENVAILTSNEEVNHRFARYFCDFITERYGYPSFPFKSMDAITLDMRRMSCTTEEGERLLISDLENRQIGDGI